MKIVLVKKYIKIRFFLTKGSTYPPGGWGGVLRIYGFKASVPTFFMDLSPMPGAPESQIQGENKRT